MPQNRVIVQIADHVGGGGRTTREELLKVFQLQYGRMAPPLKMGSHIDQIAKKPFLRQLLSGQKRMLLLSEARFVTQAERYPELSVTSLLQHVHMELPQALEYLPDDPTPETICRKFLMNIMNTLDDGLIFCLRTEAINRAKNRGNDGPEEIELSQVFQGIINNPLFSLAGNRRLLNGLRR